MLEASTANDLKTPLLDVEKIRQDFPILHQEVHGKPLVYLTSSGG